MVKLLSRVLTVGYVLLCTCRGLVRLTHISAYSDLVHHFHFGFGVVDFAWLPLWDSPAAAEESLQPNLTRVLVCAVDSSSLSFSSRKKVNSSTGSKLCNRNFHESSVQKQVSSYNVYLATIFVFIYNKQTQFAISPCRTAQITLMYYFHDNILSQWNI